MSQPFALTYDYLCPFARIANEMAIEAIADGSDLSVRFTPFSLAQNSRPEGEPVWDDEPGPAMASGVLALLWSVAVRDEQPEVFEDFHLALFAARHDDGADIADESVVALVAEGAGVDATMAAAHVASGRAAKTLAVEHSAHVDDHGVFGVPTFIRGDQAVFVRFMERHKRSDLFFW